MGRWSRQTNRESQPRRRTTKLTDRSGPAVTLKCKPALNRPAPVRCSDLVSTFMVTIYKNRKPGGNGEMVVATDAADLRAFIPQLADAILAAVTKLEGDEQFTVHGILENAIPIAFKLNGYKAETVHEIKTLTSGFSSPAECDKIAEC